MRTFRPIRFAVLASPLALAGCTPLHWDKPGLEAAALERDLVECRQLARAQAVREAWPFGLTGPRMIGVDRNGRAIWVEPFPRDTDRFLIEHDLVRGCMHTRGYQLVPADKDAAKTNKDQR